jgi:hypothetical protein
MRKIWLVAAKWTERVGLVSMFGFWRIEMMSGNCPIRKQAKSSKQPRSIRSPFVVASKVGRTYYLFCEATKTKRKQGGS